MQVSKKQIIAFRFVMWGGLALAVAGAVVFYALPSHIDWSIILLAAGLVISFIGASLLKHLFRCPNCKTNVLDSNSSVDLRMTNIPKSCPKCHTQVELID